VDSSPLKSGRERICLRKGPLARSRLPGLLLATTLWSCRAPAQNISVLVDPAARVDYSSENALLPYWEFADKHAGESRPLSSAHLEERLARDGAFTWPEKKDRLQGRTTHGLNIDHLLKKIDRTPLRVTVVSVRDEESHTEQLTIFEEEHVGRFYVMFLVPKARRHDGAGIIGLHGHFGSHFVFRDEYMGADLARAGYLVAIPWFRAMNLDAAEYGIGRHLFLRGFHLMGLRVYETLLVMRYMKSGPGLRADRIGLLGHSGGSSVGTLVARSVKGVSALVRDHENNYVLDEREYKMGVHCETIGFANGDEINDGSTMACPVLHIPYGFKEPRHRRRIIDFFGQTLSRASGS